MTAQKKKVGKLRRKRESTAPSKRKSTATKRAAPRSSFHPSEREELRIKREALQKFREEYEKALRDRVAKKKKKKRGRPTVYDEEKVVGMIEAYTETLEMRNFFSFCSMESLAEFIGVHRDTLYKWMTKFPPLKESIGRFTQKRDALFYAFVPVLKPASWIFLAKNWLGMTDRQITEIDAKNGLLVQYISHIPAPRSAKIKKKEVKKKEKEPDALKEERLD